MAHTPTPAANAPADASTSNDAAAAGATETTETTAPIADDRERHEARVLNAFGDYSPNDIALLTEDELASRDGVDVDSHPAAVDYAKSLRA